MDHVPQLTFNLVFFGLIGGLAVLGLLFGEGRMRMVAFGSFLALFVMSQMSDSSLAFLTKPLGNIVGENNVASTVGGIVLILFIIGAFVGSHKKGANLRAMLLGVVTGLFILSYGTALLPAQVKETVLTTYNLAAIITSIRPYILIALVVLILISIFVPEKKDDDKKKR